MGAIGIDVAAEPGAAGIVEHVFGWDDLNTVLFDHKGFGQL